MRVLVLAEHRAGEVEPITHQLVQQARALAAEAEVDLLVACGPGASLAERLEGAGADRLLAVEGEAYASFNGEAYGRAAEAAVARTRPAVVLCGHTFQGTEVAPWLAARLEAPMAPNCLSLRWDGGFVAERVVYGGAWQVTLRLPTAETVVATMAHRGAAPLVNAPVAPIERLDVSAEGLRTQVRESVAPVGSEGDITKADVVVGVGRGIKDPGNLGMVEELARALGGVVACSRPLVDLEWMPHERQVGASGQEIASKVYIACGISGAAQHLAGIRAVQTVIAINKDREAPIFGLSHVGVAADLFEIVPALTEEARRRRAQRD